jgi:SWIM zinc finger
MGDPHALEEGASAFWATPALTPGDVADLTDAGSFSRGEQYRRQGAIRQPVRRGRTLTALCRGSAPAPYRVTVELGDPALARGPKIAAWGCSCPRGGFCKHIVALLLTWIEASEEFDVRSTTAEILAGASQADLLRLVEEMVAHDPSLQALVDRRRPKPAPAPAVQPGDANILTIDVTGLRRKVRQALEDLPDYDDDEGYDGYGRYDEYLAGEAGEFGGADQLQEFVDQGAASEEAGRVADAIAIYETVVGVAMEQDDYLIDGLVGDTLLTCGRGLLRCLERQASLAADDRLGAADRAALVDSLFQVWRFAGSEDWGADDAEAEEAESEAAGAVDGGDVEVAIAAVLTDEERERLVDRLRDLLDRTDQDSPIAAAPTKRAAIRFLFKLRPGGDEELLEAYARAGLWDETASLLIDRGRIDEAVAVAGRHLTQPAAALAFADRLLARGGEDVERGLRFVDGRLWETEGVRPHDDLAYLEWLSARYAEHGMAEKAFQTDRRRFKRRPDFRLYEAVRDSACRPGLEPGLWERTRPQLLSELTDRKMWGTLIDVYLHEGQVADAIAALKELERSRERTATAGGLGGYGSLYGAEGWWGVGGYRQAVAKAAARDFPDEAVRLYRLLADAAIAGRQRQSYATAATYLAALRRILEANGRADEWRALITGLREEHRRLRALKEELDALGLA